MCNFNDEMEKLHMRINNDSEPDKAGKHSLRGRLPLLAVVLCVLAAAPRLSAQTEWPQFHGPRGDMTGASGVQLARKWPEAGPKVVWNTANPAGNRSYAGAAIKDGGVYVMDRVGGTDTVRRLSLQDGTDVWSRSYEAPGKFQWASARCTPAVDEARVYTTGPRGHLTCLNRETGEILWAVDLFTEFDAAHYDASSTYETPDGAGFSSSVLLWGDLAIVAPQGSKGSLAAYKRDTGVLAWKTPFVGDGSHGSPVLAQLAGREQLVMNFYKLGAGFDPATGAELWRIPLYSPHRSCASAAFLPGDRLYFSFEAMAPEIVQVSAKDGGGFKARRVAALEVFLGAAHRPVYYDGHIYAMCQHHHKTDPGLHCLDAKDFSVKWRLPDQANAWGSTILIDDLLFHVNREGSLLMIEPTPEEPRVLGTFPLPIGKSIVQIAAAGPLLVFRNDKSTLCLDMSESANGSKETQP
jgi:outer membrane protein assembly factor BamB